MIFEVLGPLLQSARLHFCYARTESAALWAVLDEESLPLLPDVRVDAAHLFEWDVVLWPAVFDRPFCDKGAGRGAPALVLTPNLPLTN